MTIVVYALWTFLFDFLLTFFDIHQNRVFFVVGFLAFYQQIKKRPSFFTDGDTREFEEL